MKIAILYIATGKYIIFWEKFFESAEMNFLPGIEKEYFVFTDADPGVITSNGNVTVIPHEQLGWPYDTLMRFHIFSRIEDSLKDFDFIFFFNANMEFVQKIEADEFLPNGKTDDGLLVTLHPGYHNQQKDKFPYERTQVNSKAFIGPSEGTYYFMGGLNGGIATKYLQLILTLKQNTQEDADNGITAIWHDESHLNRYMIGRNPKILTPDYGYPEGRNLPFTPKIIIRDKNNYGGHAFLRNEKPTLLYRLKQKFKKIKKML